IFLKLFNEYNKNIESVSKKHLPLEGNSVFHDKVRKECSKHVNEINSLVNAREEYEEKLEFENIKNENKKLQQQLIEQAEMIKEIKEQLKNRPDEEIVKRIRGENVNDSEELNKKNKLDKNFGILESEKIEDVIEKYFKLNDKEFIGLTSKLRGHEFEKMTCNFLKYIGSDATIRKVPDGGIDIHGKFGNVYYVMQLKYHYDTKKYSVNVEDVRSFYGSYSHYYGETQYIGIFLTNSKYTKDAIRK
ncbi:4587_t:CDS:2, partial [Cetraspora pellucida]